MHDLRPSFLICFQRENRGLSLVSPKMKMPIRCFFKLNGMPIPAASSLSRPNVQPNPARARTEPANRTNPDGARSGLGEG
jgi:hypothetical protein